MTTSTTIHGMDCAHAWEAMPWVLQESAPQEQGEWLMNHLAHCESCRAEFVQQSRLRLAMSLPSDLPIDPTDGLRRLLNRLDTSVPQEMPVRVQSGTWLTRALVAAVLIQALGMGAMGVKLWSADRNAPYRTLSEMPSPAPSGAIRVVPDAGMKLADWDAILQALGLRVVDGPNDVGAYMVAPVSPTSTARHALQQLRVTRGIRLAEPVSSVP